MQRIYLIAALILHIRILHSQRESLLKYKSLLKSADSLHLDRATNFRSYTDEQAVCWPLTCTSHAVTDSSAWAKARLCLLLHPSTFPSIPVKKDLIYADQCSEECSKLHINETKQPLYRHTAQYIVQHLYFKETSLKNLIHIWGREDRWVERRVKESIYFRIEKLCLYPQHSALSHHLFPGSFNSHTWAQWRHITPVLLSRPQISDPDDSK